MQKQIEDSVPFQGLRSVGLTVNLNIVPSTLIYVMQTSSDAVLIFIITLESNICGFFIAWKCVTYIILHK